MRETIVSGRLQFEDDQGRRFYPMGSVASWSWWSTEMVLRFAGQRNRKADTITYEGQTLYTDEFLYAAMSVATDSTLATLKFRKKLSGGRLVL